jgi:hypothetical protein
MDTYRREVLARKGRTLYAKFCAGDGSCAVSFALHHLRRGETEVVDDLVAFLEGRVVALERDNPDGRLEQTRTLLERIRGHRRPLSNG